MTKASAAIYCTWVAAGPATNSLSFGLNWPRNRLNAEGWVGVWKEMPKALHARLALGSGSRSLPEAPCSIWSGCPEGTPTWCFHPRRASSSPRSPGFVATCLGFTTTGAVFGSGFGGGSANKAPISRMRAAASQITRQNRRWVTDICFVSASAARRHGAGPWPHPLDPAQALPCSPAWRDNKRSLFIYDGWTRAGHWHGLQGRCVRIPFSIFSLPSLRAACYSLCPFSQEIWSRNK